MLIALGSTKGAPGVTSAALALAAVWPRPVVLLEADPSGGDLALRCTAQEGGPPSAQPDLISLATTVRGGVLPGFNLLVEQSQRLGCGVNLIPGVVSPSQTRGLRGLWPAIAQACRASDADVLVDLGRFDARGESLSLAAVADSVLVVGGRSMESVVHLREGLGELSQALNREERIATFVPVVVGPDSHGEHDRSDVDRVLAAAGLPVAAAQSIAYDPRALRRLEAGEAPRRMRRSLLLRSASAAARALGAEPAPSTAPAPAPDGQESTAVQPHAHGRMVQSHG